MTGSKLDRLVADVAAAQENIPPVPADMTPVVAERLAGETVTAFWFNGAVLWLDLDSDTPAGVPAGAQKLYVRADGH